MSKFPRSINQVEKFCAVPSIPAAYAEVLLVENDAPSRKQKILWTVCQVAVHKRNGTVNEIRLSFENHADPGDLGYTVSYAVTEEKITRE